MYVCVYAYVHVYVHMYVYAYVYVHVHVCVCVCLCLLDVLFNVHGQAEEEPVAMEDSESVPRGVGPALALQHSLEEAMGLLGRLCGDW